MLRNLIYSASLLLSLSALNANAFEFQTRDAQGTPIKTCDRPERCETMPNSKDLDGLQVRQTLTPERNLLLYSRNVSFMCTMYQDNWVLSVRVVKGALPVYRPLNDNVGVVKIDCANELSHRTITFYIPAVDYYPAFMR